MSLLLDNLAQWLDEACEGHHLADPRLALTDVSDTNTANSRLYLRGIRSRLQSLGYLSASDTDEGFTPALRAAIRHFQAEAGFSGDAVDGWLGPRTWQRLQQLLSFEAGPGSADWRWAGDKPELLPVIGRALYLRLQTLGLMPESERLEPDSVCRLDDHGEFFQAFTRLLAYARDLGLDASVPTAELNSGHLALVFNHDAFIVALSEHPEFLARADTRAFSEALGRIELWLLGYDVDLRGAVRYGLRKRGVRGPKNQTVFERVDTVELALADIGAKLTMSRSKTTAGRFDSVFFRQMAELARADEGDGEFQDALMARAVAHQTSIIDKLDRLASRIWDGMKRLWAWLRHSLSGAWGTLEDELWNVARWLAAKSRKSYGSVLKAIDILHRAAFYGSRRAFPGSDPDASLLFIRRDFDVDFWVAEAPARDWRELVAAEHVDSRCFVMACRILSVVLAALADALKFVISGGLGWFTLLLGLARAADDLGRLGEELARFELIDLGAESLYGNYAV